MFTQLFLLSFTAKFFWSFVRWHIAIFFAFAFALQHIAMLLVLKILFGLRVLSRFRLQISQLICKQICAVGSHQFKSTTDGQSGVLCFCKRWDFHLLIILGYYYISLFRKLQYHFCFLLQNIYFFPHFRYFASLFAFLYATSLYVIILLFHKTKARLHRAFLFFSPFVSVCK